MLRSKSPSAPSATLADLKPGESGEVTGYEQANDPLTQRLMHLGVLRGRSLTVVRRAPAGDPIEVHVGHSSLLLRRNEAARIRVERTTAATPRAER